MLNNFLRDKIYCNVMLVVEGEKIYIYYNIFVVSSL